MLVTGAFDHFQEALSALFELVEERFPPKSLSLMARVDGHKAPGTLHSGLDSCALGLSDTFETFTVRCGRDTATLVWANGPIAAALHDGSRPGNGAFLDALAAAGLGRTTAWYLVDAVCNGRVLLSVHCEENRVRVARDILNGHDKPIAARARAGMRRSGSKMFGLEWPRREAAGRTAAAVA